MGAAPPLWCQVLMYIAQGEEGMVRGAVVSSCCERPGPGGRGSLRGNVPRIGACGYSVLLETSYDREGDRGQKQGDQQD